MIKKHIATFAPCEHSESWVSRFLRRNKGKIISLGRKYSREAREDRTGSNGYKNVLDLIITLVVVNFNKFFSYTD